MPFFHKQYEKWYKNQGTQYSEAHTNELIRTANDADPTGERAVYTQWLINMDIAGKIAFPEDIEKVKEALTIFDRVKKLANVNIPKDINQYKSYSELAKAIEPYETEISKGERERVKVRKGSKEIYNDGLYIVYWIDTPEASHDLCYKFGAKNWCTKDVSYAKQYLTDGPLFMFLKDGKPYAQAHVESQSLMDKYDHPADEDLYNELKPILKELGIKLDTFEFNHGNLEEILKEMNIDELIHEPNFNEKFLTLQDRLDAEGLPGDATDDIRKKAMELLEQDGDRFDFSLNDPAFKVASFNDWQNNPIKKITGNFNTTIYILFDKNVLTLEFENELKRYAKKILDGSLKAEQKWAEIPFHKNTLKNILNLIQPLFGDGSTEMEKLDALIHRQDR